MKKRDHKILNKFKKKLQRPVSTDVSRPLVRRFQFLLDGHEDPLQ